MSRLLSTFVAAAWACGSTLAFAQNNSQTMTPPAGQEKGPGGDMTKSQGSSSEGAAVTGSTKANDSGDASPMKGPPDGAGPTGKGGAGPGMHPGPCAAPAAAGCQK